jgi:hypothetical protein
MQNFSSMPPEQEAAFVVYEERSVTAAKKAMTLGVIVGVSFFLVTILIVFSHSKPKSKMEGEDMGMLADEKERAAERSQLKSDAPAPTPTPEGGTAPAPAPTPAPEGGTAPAPATP